jgi:hypothetical protein
MLAWIWDIFPTIKVVGESVEFSSHCLPKLGLDRTASGGAVRRVVFIVLSCFGMCLKHAWIRDIIEVVLVGLPRIKEQLIRYGSRTRGIIEPVILQEIAFGQEAL